MARAKRSPAGAYRENFLRCRPVPLDLPLPADRVWAPPDERLLPYIGDEAARGVTPVAVAFPLTTAEVAAVLKWATARRVPVIPRGAGSGLAGGAAATDGAVVLALERMNRLIAIDETDRVAVAQPGVITGDIRRAAEAKGLLYAPIPASVDLCSIGGNVATNAGGLCAVKYGVTREHVLALEAVLPTGEILRTGGRYEKSSAGYDLTQLICGSEGTLAVVTEVTLKLLPLPRERMTMLLPFDSTVDVARAVAAMLGAVVPPTMELLPRAAVELTRARNPQLPFPFPDRAASLLVEMDGDDADAVAAATARAAEIAKRHGAGEPAVAGTAKQRDELWTLRKRVRDSIAGSGPYVEADSVVPRAKLPELLAAADDAARAAGVSQISYGHAGDGNLHTYFRRGALDDASWKQAGETALRHFFESTAKLGGTISGEHGVGLLKRDFLPIAVDPAAIALMRRIKSAFDPAGILNPHKVLPGG